MNCLIDGLGTRKCYNRDVDSSYGKWCVDVLQILARRRKWSLSYIWSSSRFRTYLVWWLFGQKLLLEKFENKWNSHSYTIPFLVVAWKWSSTNCKINTWVQKVNVILHRLASMWNHYHVDVILFRLNDWFYFQVEFTIWHFNLSSPFVQLFDLYFLSKSTFTNFLLWSHSSISICNLVIIFVIGAIASIAFKLHSHKSDGYVMAISPLLLTQFIHHSLTHLLLLTIAFDHYF